MSGFNIVGKRDRRNLDEAPASSLDASLMKAAPCCWSAALLSTARGGLELISLLVRVRVTLARVQLDPALGESTILVPATYSLLLFDAGHVSAAPQLIYHSNCEWRTGTAEEQRKAALTLPSLTIYLVICAKAVPSMENGDLVFRGSRWAKTTQHTPRWLSGQLGRLWGRFDAG